MATTTKNTSTKNNAKPGKIIEPPTSTLADYLEQWNKFGEKKKAGKAREKELDTVLETAQEDLSEADFAELEKAIAPERVEKRENTKPRAAKGEGMSRADWRAMKFVEAEQKGVWYPGYEDGCTVCGLTDRKHYSGGKCTRCYTLERNARLGIDKEREDKRKARDAEKEERMKAVAEMKAKKELEKLEKKRAADEKKAAAAEKKKSESGGRNLTKEMDEKLKAEIAEKSRKMAEEAAAKDAEKPAEEKPKVKTVTKESSAKAKKAAAEKKKPAAKKDDKKKAKV